MNPVTRLRRMKSRERNDCLSGESQCLSPGSQAIASSHQQNPGYLYLEQLAVVRQNKELLLATNNEKKQRLLAQNEKVISLQKMVRTKVKEEQNEYDVIFFGPNLKLLKVN